MSRPGIEPGPLAWEASTLEKSHLDSLFAAFSEPLRGLEATGGRSSTSLIILMEFEHLKSCNRSSKIGFGSRLDNFHYTKFS
jgi:hypothetical protein